MLEVLLASGDAGATTRQLGQAHVGGFRFGARVHELRQAGWEITARRESPASSRYVLLEEVVA